MGEFPANHLWLPDGIVKLYVVVSQAPLMMPDAYFRHLRIRLQGVIQKHHVLKPLTYPDQPEMLPNLSPSHGQPRDTPDRPDPWPDHGPSDWFNPPCLAKHPQFQPMFPNLWSALPQTPAFTYLSPIFHLSFTYLSPIFHLSFTYLSPIFHLSFTYLSLVARYKHTSYDLS